MDKNYTTRRDWMPTIMPFQWRANKPKPVVKISAHGFRAWFLRVPYVFSFPYFQGNYCN